MAVQNKVENKSKNQIHNSPKDAQQKDSKIPKKAHSVISTIIAIASIITLVVVVSGGVFYFIIRSDLNGVATKNRNTIIKIPILKTALPKPKDPEDPKYLSSTEILNKYNELRKKRDELTNSLNEAKKTIDELQKFKNNVDAVTAAQEKNKNELDTLKKTLDQQAIQNAEDKKKIDELVASGDKEGFKAYFEKVNKEIAQQTYEKIMNEQKASEETQKLVKLYEGMDAAAAAKVLAEMETNQFDLLVQIIKNMNSTKASEVMAATAPALAAKITAKIAEANK